MALTTEMNISCEKDRTTDGGAGPSIGKSSSARYWCRKTCANRHRRRLTIAGCLLLASANSSGESPKQTFSGSWDWADSPQSRNFSIILKQQRSKLSGQYCAVAENGNRIDCDDDEHPNIHGSVDAEAMTASVGFSSFFGAENGRALLKIDGGRLIWKIIKDPIGGDFYAPKNAVLKRGK